MRTGLARLALVSALLASAAPALGQSYRLRDTTADVKAGKATIQADVTGARSAKSYVTIYTGARTDTAVPGVDYSPIAKVFEVLPTDTKLLLDVTLTNDGKPGPSKSISTFLVINRGGTLLDGAGKVTITNSNVTPPPIPAPCPAGTVLSAAGHCEPVPPVVVPPVVVPPVEPPPVAIPPVAGDELALSLDGLAPIASEFDPMKGMKAPQFPPSSAAPDVLGALRFTCGFAGLGYFDPIVYPGDRTGKSHLHQFYGNTGVNPDSTYSSLRSSGKSTCAYGDYPVNRSPYWQAALLDGKGNALQPDWATIYYKRRPANDPVVSAKPGTLVTNLQGKPERAMGIAAPLPFGLKFIFGFDMITGKTPTGSVDYVLVSDDGNGTVYGPYYNFAQVKASGRFLPGYAFMARITAPGCWDGKRTDSANHRDHVSYASYGDQGYLRCDDAHPFVIPEFKLLSKWSIVPGDEIGDLTWRWSSDEAMRAAPGTTFHADFEMAHDPVWRDVWNVRPDSCINGLLNCSSGVSSKTLQIVDASVPKYPDATGALVGNWKNPQRIVPLSTITDKAKLYGFKY